MANNKNVFLDDKDYILACLRCYNTEFRIHRSGFLTCNNCFKIYYWNAVTKEFVPVTKDKKSKKAINEDGVEIQTE
jgi:hypothetical protein